MTPIVHLSSIRRRFHSLKLDYPGFKKSGSLSNHIEKCTDWDTAGRAAGALTGAVIPVAEQPLRTSREAPALQQHQRSQARRAVLGRIPHTACTGGVALCREGNNKNTQQA